VASLQCVEDLYRQERDRILATLIRFLHDFDLAEEMMQEAFVTALDRWPIEGVPENPRAWIVSTARNKAIDYVRRNVRFREKLPQLCQLIDDESKAAPFEVPASMPSPASMVPDDRLRLIFTCCHPALPLEAQIALTLRTLCGLSTNDIARGFLLPAATMAQRLVRAKRKIRDARIPYLVPPAHLLIERLEAVLKTVYLIFTEGYAATSGDRLVRKDLCQEAIRLGRLLVELLPQRNEPRALLALMLLHDSRRDARTDARGDIVPLEEQDRSRWNTAQIQEGIALVEIALRAGGATASYALEAAIAALHAEAKRPDQTDWPQIARLYEMLARLNPSPVVSLNRAVAVAMAEGPEHGLRMLNELEGAAELSNYHLLPAAKAYIFQLLGRWDEAVPCYRRALSLAGNEPERRFLENRLAKADHHLSGAC
jgi:RNA polymerase sigma-70 factor, ECF subfamily